VEFAVVYKEHPSEVVLTTGSPFEADTNEIAAREVYETFAAEDVESAYDWLQEQGWRVVPLTDSLRAQYEHTSNCPSSINPEREST
jgi:hypothetical protein